MTRAQCRARGGGGQEAAVVPWTLYDGQASGQRLDLQGQRVPGLLYIQSTAGHTAGLGRAFCPGPGAAGAVGGRRRQDWPGPVWGGQLGEQQARGSSEVTGAAGQRKLQTQSLCGLPAPWPGTGPTVCAIV